MFWLFSLAVALHSRQQKTATNKTKPPLQENSIRLNKQMKIESSLAIQRARRNDCFRKGRTGVCV